MGTIANIPVTMSSIELVAVINELREAGKAEILHKNFLAKIEAHPGITSAEFLAYVPITVGNGAVRKSKVYNLPKRECELMVMSESLAVQARVYDRMTALEKQLSADTTTAPTAVPATKEFRALYGIARMLGLDKNVAAISANQATNRITGTNVLRLLGQEHLGNGPQVLFFTPTELGKRIGCSARQFNMLLADAGLQVKKGETWDATPAADGVVRILDTGKRRGDGTMVQQVKWSDGVLPLVQPKRVERTITDDELEAVLNGM